MTRAVFTLCVVSLAASGCASFTTQFGDLRRVVKPGDAVTVVGKDDRVTTGRVESLPETPGDPLIVNAVATRRTFRESDIAKIQRHRWVPLSGAAKGAGFGFAYVMAAACGGSTCGSVPAPALGWATAGGGIAGLVWGLTKPLINVYEYAVLDVMDPALFPLRSSAAGPTVVSASARWSLNALRNIAPDDLELEPGKTRFGSLEWDFGYSRLLLRPSAGDGHAARHLALELDDLHQVTCEERPELSEEARQMRYRSLDRKTAEALAARHVWCQIDYGKSSNSQRSVFVQIGPLVGSAATAEERAKRVITLMKALLGDKLTVLERPAGRGAQGG